MATIQLGTTKNINSLLSYCEKKSDITKGIDCSEQTAKQQMRATRELFNKNDKIQGHHVIQSFKPQEVTPEKANEIGQKLAAKLAEGHEVMVYTHTDKEHIHNHIVINSVNFEDGKKFQLHGTKGIEKVRQLSDDLCKENDLSIVDKNVKADRRYSRAEYGLAKRGLMSWKDEIREVIDLEKDSTDNFAEFKTALKEKYDVDVLERGKHITFVHPNGKKVRGVTLGNDFEKEVLKDVIGKSNEQTRAEQGIGNTTERDKGTEQPHEELYNRSNGQRFNQSTDSTQRDTSDREYKQEDTRPDDFDNEKARKLIESTARENARSVGELSRPDARSRDIEREKARDIERANSKKHAERTKYIKSRGHER